MAGVRAALVKQKRDATIVRAIATFYVISIEQLHERLLCLAHVEDSSFLLVNA